MIKTWLNEWFIKNSQASENDILNNSSGNYFELQWIDSFLFISFISEVEEKFNISFSNDDFQNREFATIDGLTKIIQGKLNV